MLKKRTYSSVLISITLLITLSCNNIENDKEEKKITNDSSMSKKYSECFDLISSYPLIKDTAAFIEKLVSCCDTNIPNPKSNSTITHYEKISIYGSDMPIYIVEYNWGEDCMAYYPWKYQIFFNEKGKYLGCEEADSFAMVNVIKDQNPLLMMLVSTAHGFGWHCFYKYDKDSCKLVDMLIGEDNSGDSPNTTYCSNVWYEDNEPNGLNLLIKDYNNDGYNDIIFYGQKEVYYNYKENYSEEKPIDEYPVEDIFLYDKNKDQFILEN